MNAALTLVPTATVPMTLMHTRVYVRMVLLIRDAPPKLTSVHHIRVCMVNV